MGLWQIFNADGVAQDEQFDDGLAFMPGEDGYSTKPVAAHAASFGPDFTFNLIGVPNWHARVEAEVMVAAEAEQAARAKNEAAEQKRADKAEQDRARAAAEAELAATIDPRVPVRARINAKFDAMLAALPERADDIEPLRAAALKEVGA